MNITTKNRIHRIITIMIALATLLIGWKYLAIWFVLAALSAYQSLGI